MSPSRVTLGLGLILTACTSSPAESLTTDALVDTSTDDAVVLNDTNDTVPDVSLAPDVTEDVMLVLDATDVPTSEVLLPPADTHDVVDVDVDADADVDVDVDVDVVEDVSEIDSAVEDTSPPEQDTTNTPQDVATVDTSPPPKPGNCCEASSVPECEKSLCTVQVCALDSFCCDGYWDINCAKCAQGGLGFNNVDCSGLHTVCGCEKAAPTHEQIAKHWAPVWYHDTDDDDYDADYITAIDFDGDMISENNWENLDAAFADLSAVIYWAVIETSTHWYVYYMDFHPRDWAKNCWAPFQEPCHENDMEGAMVVVRRDDTYWGSFSVLYTEAHNALHIYSNDENVLKGSSDRLLKPGDLVKGKPFKGVTFENGSHPELYVESKGHGVCALYHDGKDHCKHSVENTPPEFGGNDGVVYRYKGYAETPSSGNDQDVSYKLVAFETAIWPHRFDICDDGCLFDKTMTYDGVELAKAFDGETHGDDKANPPWAWDDPSDGPVYRGDFFFRPAKTLKTHIKVPGFVSQQYLYNPYLDSL